MTSKPSQARQWMGNCTVLCTKEKLCFDSITIMYTFKADKQDE